MIDTTQYSQNIPGRLKDILFSTTRTTCILLINFSSTVV